MCKLGYKEDWMLKNWCFQIAVLEKILESPLDCKEIQPVHPKEISPEYSLKGLTLKQKLQYLATWYQELTHWKRPWCWERLKAGGEGDDRGWDGWMASPTWWTWVWANFRRRQRTGKTGVASIHGVSKSRTWANNKAESQEMVLGHESVFSPVASPLIKAIFPLPTMSIGYWEASS